MKAYLDRYVDALDGKPNPEEWRASLVGKPLGRQRRLRLLWALNDCVVKAISLEGGGRP